MALKRIVSWFKGRHGKTAKELFEESAARLRAIMIDQDNNGIPDKLEKIAKEVATAVALLELLFPRSGAVKRGAEKLRHFIDAVFDRFPIDVEWRSVLLPQIESAVSLMKIEGR
jgi:hypothetical protein